MNLEWVSVFTAMHSPGEYNTHAGLDDPLAAARLRDGMVCVEDANGGRFWFRSPPAGDAGQVAPARAHARAAPLVSPLCVSC